MSKATGVTVKDVSAEQFITAYAAHLKSSGKLTVPKWTELAKTATYKELGPQNPDWYYVRAASLARRLYIQGGSGVGKFRHIYGGASRRGTAPSHHHRATGGVIRTALQGLEKMGVIEPHAKGGRKITKIGQRDLDRIAGRVAGRK